MSPDERVRERIKRNRTDEMREALGLPAWQWQERERDAPNILTQTD
jgi:hypothetical protein